MGEARKRRLALIKDGKATEARRPENNPTPQDLVEITCLGTKALHAELEKRYALINQEVLPTFSTFLERVLLAGIASFDKAQAQQEAQGSLIKLADGTDLAEVSRRLQALKEQV